MEDINMTLVKKLFRVQQTIGAVKKTSDNPYFKSKYADLNEVLSVAKPALHKEGLYLSQGPGLNEFGCYVETSIIDADSGQQIFNRVPFSGNEADMQKIGAATTYARRIGIVSLLAMESEDDDGETAVGRGNAANVRATDAPKPAVGSGNGPKPITGSATAPKRSPREATNEKLTLVSKILIDQKRLSFDEVVEYLAPYGVESKEQLNDEQAKELLYKLEGVLNGS